MPTDYTIRKIDTQNAEEAARLLVREFHEREPLAHLNTADPQEFSDYILYLSNLCAAQGLGFIAKEVNSGRAIGVLLASDLSDSVNASPERNENPIAALIDSLNSTYFNKGELADNTYLNIKFVATDANIKVKGMVVTLISECLQAAKTLGFQYAQAEATGNISQHIFANKLGFDKKATIKYSEFEVNGNKPFISITGHEGIQLLIKKL
ncbi:hypothetical protein [Pseudoalteromonas ardens]|uniref:N-acetyltransferase domain-containing protein n=1 Tax=Pseudoalteromonas rubra TaxID=43658 RepID=A0A0L0EMV7_9GAMM|nr:hypothetical protein [Pseudoalteromonas sp. R96]KNC65754.1 hypothetical protein AC626_21165 [Pseudoalteromonas rubra]MDK1311295.1 hypothetical protein [Pseudoalteromonas sp. R96]